jgi:hypothetical protein
MRLWFLTSKCKHKVTLLKGETKMLFDPEEKSLLNMLHEWDGFAVLKTRLLKYDEQIAALQKQKALIDKQAKEWKKKFARALLTGDFPADG